MSDKEQIAGYAFRGNERHIMFDDEALVRTLVKLAHEARRSVDGMAQSGRTT